MRLSLFLIVLFASLDQLTKAIARTALSEPPFFYEVTSFLNFTPAWNLGVSFGMFNQDSFVTRYGLIALTTTIIIFLFVWLLRNKNVLLSIALSCIIGGALGNLIDRFVHGAVFDFIDVHALGIHFWTFNVADAFVSCGAVLVILDMFIIEWKRKKKPT